MYSFILQALRGLLTVLLLLIGALLTFPAAAALWEQRVLMDDDRFVEVGNEVLRRDAVQRALAERLADEAVAIDDRVDAATANSIALEFVRDLPDSDIANAALLTAHDLLVRLVRGDALEAQGETIVLDLRAVLARVLDDLGTEGRFIRRELPPNAGEVALVRKTDLTEAFRVARWFDASATYIALLPVVALALAVVVARRRPRALIYAGLLVLLTAVARIGLLESPLQSVVIDAALQDPTAKQAANDAYDVLAATFERQDIYFAALGVATAVVGLVIGVATLAAKRT